MKTLQRVTENPLFFLFSEKDETGKARTGNLCFAKLFYKINGRQACLKKLNLTVYVLFITIPSVFLLFIVTGLATCQVACSQTERLRFCLQYAGKPSGMFASVYRKMYFCVFL